MEVEVSSLEVVLGEGHKVALESLGPSFQEVVLDLGVLGQVKEVSYLVGVVQIEMFQGVVHLAVRLELMWVLELKAVALEVVAQEPFWGPPGSPRSFYYPH